MARLIDSEKLIEYCNNQKVKTIDANDIARFPIVDAAHVKHGRWETDLTEQNEFWAHYCNRCSTYLPYGRDWKPNYCPNCGAKMDLEE